MAQSKATAQPGGGSDYTTRKSDIDCAVSSTLGCGYSAQKLKQEMEELARADYIPSNIAASMYNAWFKREYPELFAPCEIAETVESCEECHFCDTKQEAEQGES